jgi:hypothetical protein
MMWCFTLNCAISVVSYLISFIYSYIFPQLESALQLTNFVLEYNQNS